MKKKILLFFSFLFTFSVIACSKAPEIDEEELKQFVIEYDDALSKGWSESDEIIPKDVEKNFFTPNTGLDHCSNKYWFIYEDEIEFRYIEKVPRDEYDVFGKNSYSVGYRRKVLYEIKGNLLVPVMGNRDNYGYNGAFVAQVDNELKVTFAYPDSCWVKEKHLPALIKRKGLVYAE